MPKKPTLDEIIEKLDPDIINEKVEQPHATARATYGSKKTTAKAWAEFRKEVIDYVKHHHKSIYKTDIDDARAYSIADRILAQKRNDGGAGGIGNAYSDAKKGKLQDTFNIIHKGMESEHINDYNRHVFSEVDPLDFEHSTEMVKQYIDKYGSMLPKGVAAKLKKKKPEELANAWRELAEAHGQVVYAHRATVKAYDPGGAAPPGGGGGGHH